MGVLRAAGSCYDDGKHRVIQIQTNPAWCLTMADSCLEYALICQKKTYMNLSLRRARRAPIARIAVTQDVGSHGISHESHACQYPRYPDLYRSPVASFPPCERFRRICANIPSSANPSVSPDVQGSLSAPSPCDCAKPVLSAWYGGSWKPMPLCQSRSKYKCFSERFDDLT